MDKATPTPSPAIAAIMHDVRELRVQTAMHSGESTGNLDVLERRIEDGVRVLAGLHAVQPELPEVERLAAQAAPTEEKRPEGWRTAIVAARRAAQAPVVQAVQAGEYPPLPEPEAGFQYDNGYQEVMRGAFKDPRVIVMFTADQMHAYLDADRASSGAAQAVRMLTDAEQTAIIDMHSTGRAQGDHECAEDIQRKFAKVNGLRIPADGKIGSAA